MDSALKSKCDLFVNNRYVLEKAFFLGSGLMAFSSALLFDEANVCITPEVIKNCNVILEANTGVFSEFRGTVKLPLLCKMALSNKPDEYLQKVIHAHEFMKKIKWVNDQFRIMAAITICDHAEEKDYERYADRTVELYKKMKEKHSILTGDEDIPFATLLAVSNIDIDYLISNMEESYQLLKKHFHDANAVQSLSHILSLSSVSPEIKCARVVDLFEAFKKTKHKYGTGYELSTLGVVSMLDCPADEIVQEISEVDDYLKTQKGFGGLNLDATQRRLFASQLVLNHHGFNPKCGGTDVALGSMLALTIAIEIAILICVMSCINTTNATT